MDSQPTRMEGTAKEFNAALAALDAAMIEVDDLQRKFDQVSTRIETLLVNTATSPKANLGANLRSLNARSEVLRKALDRARRGYASARKTYHQVSQRYSAHRELHDSSVTALRLALANAERCKSALGRSLTEMLDRQTARHTDLPSNEDRQSLPGHDGSYGYIAINVARFFELLIALERALAVDPDYEHPQLRHRPVSFLDVGCGTGRNLSLVRDCQLLQVAGLAGFDINAEQIAAGRAVYDLQDELSVADAMTFDYGPHDVVYSFRPFHDPEMMTRFETHLVAGLRRGAYLIAVLPEDLSRFAGLDCIDPAHGIWKKTG
ncbi:class I SAM-dependent methyltransferase [Sedimentitalea sp. HM32M-2]|uniref:class I SAM-dependent methyltransferase n=1 Tax=Sedimentitalea sp. HM32M-2 TaxID=3351566 RepID=UPI003644B988